MQNEKNLTFDNMDVKQDKGSGKWGFTRKGTNDVLIPFIYDYAENLYTNLKAVGIRKIDGKDVKFYLDPDGKENSGFDPRMVA